MSSFDLSLTLNKCCECLNITVKCNINEKTYEIPFYCYIQNQHCCDLSEMLINKISLFIIIFIHYFHITTKCNPPNITFLPKHIHYCKVVINTVNVISRRPEWSYTSLLEHFTHWILSPEGPWCFCLQQKVSSNTYSHSEG